MNLGSSARASAVRRAMSANGMVRPCSCPASDEILARGCKDQKWSRGQIEARLANMPPCLIGMEACVGAHHLSRKLKALGHDARLMPAKYVRPYSKGQKNDFRDAEAIAEAVQRPRLPPVQRYVRNPGLYRKCVRRARNNAIDPNVWSGRA